MQGLDLQYDDATRYYQAPAQIKANGGMLLVDDLGRQLVSPRDLMNRWIVPLDRRCDFLTLKSGYRFEMPFDLSLIFSTNLSPADLADEAFLRRFGYKVHLGPLSESAYLQVFREQCEKMSIEFSQEAFTWLIEQRHRAFATPLLACYPRDLLGRIHDQANYSGIPAIADSTALLPAE